MSTSAENAFGNLSSGLPALKFETVGTRHEGTITRVSDVITQPKLGASNGETQDSVVFDLTMVDGTEGALWVKIPSALARAIADAVRAADPTRPAPIPRVGDQIVVVHHDTAPPKTPGFSPAKLYQAAVTPGSAPGAAAAMATQLTPPAAPVAAGGGFLAGGAL